MNSLSLLKRLTEAHGTSGAEGAVREIFCSELAGFGALSTDGMGSAVCIRKAATGAPRVMITSHMDEVGFAVQSISKTGCLKIVALGGWWTHNLLSQRVRILTRSGREILGIITSTPPHFLSESAKDKVLSIDQLYVDVGAESREMVEKEYGISLGDPIVPESSFTQLTNPDLLVCKAFDNRVGTAAIIEAMQRTSSAPLPCEVACVGTVQEEVGCRGAVTAAALVKPDLAFVLEGTPADDVPGMDASEAQGALRKGPQVRLLDPTALMNRKVVDFVLRTAREESIPFQVTVRRSGGTDAKSIQLASTGVPTVVIGTPARYIHSHNSIIHINDYRATVNLIVALLQRCDRAAVDSLLQF